MNIFTLSKAPLYLLISLFLPTMVWLSIHLNANFRDLP